MIKAFWFYSCSFISQSHIREQFAGTPPGVNSVSRNIETNEMNEAVCDMFLFYRIRLFCEIAERIVSRNNEIANEIPKHFVKQRNISAANCITKQDPGNVLRNN
jgi:hypothetical protein